MRSKIEEENSEDINKMDEVDEEDTFDLDISLTPLRPSYGNVDSLRATAFSANWCVCETV